MEHVRKEIASCFAPRKAAVQRVCFVIVTSVNCNVKMALAVKAMHGAKVDTARPMKRFAAMKHAPKAVMPAIAH